MFNHPFSLRPYISNGFPFWDFFVRKLESLLILPLALILWPFSLLLIRNGIYIWPIFSERLGHQCLESDCAIRWSRAHGEVRQIYLISRSHKSANSRFFDYLPPHSHHLAGRFIFACAVSLTFFNLYRTAKAFCRIPTGYQTHWPLLCSTSLVFQMSPADLQASSLLLAQLVSHSKLPRQLQDTSHYCVFNFRHPYTDVVGDHLQSQRFSSSANLRSALIYLCNIGVVPILTGSPSPRHLESLPSNLYVNYPASQFKSDYHDILLSANADFCLGSTSGLTLLSSVFGVPCLIHNQVPYKEYWYSFQDIVLPKLIHSKSDGSLIPFTCQIVDSSLRTRYPCDSPYASFYYAECSADDILQATIEMCKQLNLTSGSSMGSRNSALAFSFREKYAQYLPSQP